MKNSTYPQLVRGTQGSIDENGTISLGMKRFFSFMFCLLLASIMQVSTATSQTTSGALTPGEYCPNCTAEDIKMIGVDIVPIVPNVCHSETDTYAAKFVFNLDVTAKQRYGLVIFFEIWKKGGSKLGNYYVCTDNIFEKGPQTFPNAASSIVFELPSGYKPGEVEIKNAFTGWDNQDWKNFCARTTFTSPASLNSATVSGRTTTWGNDGTFSIVDCKRIAPKCKSYLDVPVRVTYINPKITLGDNPSLCEGTSSASLVYTSVTQNANQYSIDYDDARISDVSFTSLPASPITLTLPSNLPVGTYSATITVRNSTTNCVGSASFSVTVRAKTTITTISGCAGTYCVGDKIDLTASASGSGPITYQWYSSANNTNTGGNMIPGATNNSYSLTTEAAGTIYYYVVATGPCGSAAAPAVEIKVHPTTKITSNCGSTQSLCKNDAATALSVTVEGSDLTYQWYSSASNSTAGGSMIPGATTSSYTPSTSAEGTIYYYVKVSGKCGDATSDVATVTVKKSTKITEQPYCAGAYCVEAEASSLTVVAEGVNLMYQWYSNTTNSTLGSSAIAGETNASFTPPTTSVGSQFYYVVVTGDCGTVTSSIVEIMIEPATEITSQPTCAASGYCEGEEADELTVTAIGAELKYQWYKNTTNSAVSATAISGATSTAYTPSTDEAGDLYYFVVVDGLCNDVTSDFVKVSVYGKPRIKDGGQPEGATYCKGDETTALTVDASGYQLSYVWYSYASERSDAVSVGNTSTLSVSSDVVGTTRYFVVVSGYCSPAVTSDCVAVVVNETVDITADPDGYDICLGANAKDLVVHATGASSYQWYSNSTNSNEGGTIISGATTDTYTPPVDKAGTIYYYVVAASAFCNSETSIAVRVQITDCGSFCTYTQGYFGNDNGDGGMAKYPYNGSSCTSSRVLKTVENAIDAWPDDKIILGNPSGNNVTILKADAGRVRTFLPAGGTPAALGRSYTMDQLVAAPLKNNLLAQTMTLALNIGLNLKKNILDFPLQAKYLKTEKAMDCGSLVGNGSFKTVNFSGINMAMDHNSDGTITIGDIYATANKVLGGQSVPGVTASQIAGIAGAINEGFDECRIAKSFEDVPVISTSSLTTGISVKTYPNPFVSSFNIVFTSSANGNAKVDLFDESGRKLGVILKENVIAGVENTIQYKAPQNNPAVIFYRISIGNNVVTGKALSQVIR